MVYRIMGGWMAAAFCLITACSTGLSGSAQDVRLRNSGQLEGCENAGATHVSVADRLGQQDWSRERIASELLKLAESGAVQLGGNTLVEMTGVIDGTQSFAVFKCPDG